MRRRMSRSEHEAFPLSLSQRVVSRFALLRSLSSCGAQARGDPGECLLLLRRYYHRTAKARRRAHATLSRAAPSLAASRTPLFVSQDSQGLTFKRQEAKKGEIFVLNSSELRAVQGHQKNDFTLNPINPPKQRKQKSRSAKGTKPQELVYPASQEWALDPEVDVDTRRVCEAS